MKTVSEQISRQEDEFILGSPFLTKAPVVGSHRKSSSLVGFDPLLTPSSVSTATAMNMEGLVLSTLPNAPNLLEETKEHYSYGMEDMTLPMTPNTKVKSKFGKKKSHRKTQSLSSTIANTFSNKEAKDTLNPRKNSISLSPPRPVLQKAVTISDPQQVSPKTPSRKVLNWPKLKLGQRKTSSSSGAVSTSTPNSPQRSNNPLPRVSASAASSPAGKAQFFSMSPMIQELLEIGHDPSRKTSDTLPLLVPSLAKPRPTSFLTGFEEVSRSSEQDPTAWQLDIPGFTDVLTCAKFCQFMETYSSEECLLDLNLVVGRSRMHLSSFARGDTGIFRQIADIHRPVVESLLECGSDMSEVKGFFHDNSNDPDKRREVLVVERQNKFLCIFRGSKAEQQGKYTRQPELIELNGQARVFSDRYSAIAELQKSTFELLDKLTEENPFCDISFTGHSYGGAMATLAAYTYATTRTAIRVACCASASAKVGNADFKSVVHSTPNLTMWRLDGARPRSSTHVGHSLRLLPPGKDGKNALIQAHKFGVDSHQENLTVQLLSTGGVRSLLTQSKVKDRDINEYVSMLEDVPTDCWVKDYYKEDGEGVRGNDNEARQMA